MTIQSHSEMLDAELGILNISPVKFKKSVLFCNTPLTERLGKYGCNIYKLKKYYSNEEIYDDEFVKDIVEDPRIPTKLSLINRKALNAIKEYIVRYYEEQFLYE